MVEKDGKKVPFYAADGKGKMKYGGKVKKMLQKVWRQSQEDERWRQVHGGRYCHARQNQNQT